MSRILLLIEHSKNRQLLIELLAASYDTIQVNETTVSVLNNRFDLCLLDDISLERLSKNILIRKESEGNVFLPFLLLTSRKNAGSLSSHMARTIDEIITIPVDRSKLQARIDNLLRKRRLSYALNQDNILLKDENAQLVEQLLKAERMAAIGQAVAGISHCIKNILNGLHAGVFIIKQNLGKSDANVTEKAIQILERSFNRLQELVQDMLTYSKDREPEYEVTNLNELVNSVVELMQVKAKERKFEIRFNEGADMTGIEIDPKGIYRCILNLVSNALDASDKEGSVISLGTRISGEKEVVIEVSDQGCGMDKSTLEHIFEAFYSTKGSKGTGLGLSVTSKIVKEHGGRMEVNSVVNQGTTFLIYLPREKCYSRDG